MDGILDFGENCGPTNSFGGSLSDRFEVTCAPTSYHFLVESFDCFGLMRPFFASVDLGHIHAA